MFFIVLETIRFTFKEFTGRCAPYFSIVTRRLSLATPANVAPSGLQFDVLNFEGGVLLHQLTDALPVLVLLCIELVDLRVLLNYLLLLLFIKLLPLGGVARDGIGLCLVRNGGFPLDFVPAVQPPLYQALYPLYAAEGGYQYDPIVQFHITTR